MNKSFLVFISEIAIFLGISFLGVIAYSHYLNIHETNWRHSQNEDEVPFSVNTPEQVIREVRECKAHKDRDAKVSILYRMNTGEEYYFVECFL